MMEKGSVPERVVSTARHAGFCFGVKRAIRMVEKALGETGPVSSLGPVIHNPQVIRSLEEQGLRTVHGLDEVATGVVIIRSHGAPPYVYRTLEQRGLAFVDATCPFVKKMHAQARQLYREGYRVIIVGDRNHSEITSLTDDEHFEGIVVSCPEELEGLELGGRVGLISQTTQAIENFRAVADRILPQAAELRVLNTICDSTSTRQTEARELASRVDVMVVIGGRNSANTRRLTEICQETGTRTIWVETAGELTPELLGGAARVGVTAGASTPDWIIAEVIRRLATLPGGGQDAETIPSLRGGIPERGGSTQHAV
jgi:4-hydroxy-3-methylbut-2-enyl diphosphate reductase